MKHLRCKPPADRESDVRKAGVKLLRSLGCEPMSLSQNRPSRVARGIPDIYVVPPRNKRAFWWEVKGPTGKPSPEQVDFKAKSDAGGIVVVLGGLDELRAHLKTIGLVT